MIPSPVAAFGDAMRAAGIVPPEHIEADGALHRFSSNGNCGDDAGYYVLHLDSIPAGLFGCWRANFRQTWRAQPNGRAWTDDEEEAHRTRVAALRRQADAERKRRHANAAKKAIAIWATATPAPPDHPYLIRKAIKPHGTRDYRGALVIPVHDHDAMSSLQFIPADPNGSKTFLTGGRVTGCYSIAGADGLDDDAPTIAIAEGFATAATIQECTELPVVVAFNAGNLLAVAKAIRKAHPDARLVVCADDDHATPKNAGMTAAEEAAHAVDALLCVPVFGSDRGEKDTDFNDMARLSGPEAVRRALLDTLKLSGKTVPTEDAVLANLPEQRSRRPNANDSNGPAGSTEDECASTFARRHPDWRYTAAFGQWHYYDQAAAVWHHDNRLRHLTLIREMLRKGAPRKLHKSSAVSGVASLARSNPGCAMGPEDWDADPWLLGIPGAVINLQTGDPVVDPRACHITRQTRVAVAPFGTLTPRWTAFLERITRHDPALIAYLQRIAGYALTGSDKEQCIFFAHGPGANGKGVFMNTLTGILGDYARVASGDLLLAATGDRHPTDLASLRGARFVTASELRPGARWDEQRLKSLTGGDPITARFMRQDEFTFRPQFTLVIAGNHRPSFAGVDESIRRRMRLIPFTEVISAGERDPDLPEKLRAEWPGILRWAVDGCLAWQRDGLTMPASVRDASAAYLESEDSLGQWIVDRIRRHDPRLRILTSRKVLFDDWTWWSGENGGPKWSAKAFYSALEERGFAPHMRDGTRGFLDASLTSATPEQFASKRP